MSQLIMRGHDGSRFDLNITQFRSPMSATIVSVQTRSREHHFPIRAGQPDIQFTAHFASLDEKHRFQSFVRDHQLNTAVADYSPGANAYRRGAVTLMWPERDIVNWTGYITGLPVREPRFEYAPRVTFGVMLLDSLMSVTTTQASLGNGFNFVLGPQIPAWQDIWGADAGLVDPTDPADDPAPAPAAVVEAAGSLIGGIADLVTGLFR
jgi:hypothetical protein